MRILTDIEGPPSRLSPWNGGEILGEQGYLVSLSVLEVSVLKLNLSSGDYVFLFDLRPQEPPGKSARHSNFYNSLRI